MCLGDQLVKDWSTETISFAYAMVRSGTMTLPRTFVQQGAFRDQGTLVIYYALNKKELEN